MPSSTSGKRLTPWQGSVALLPAERVPGAERDAPWLVIEQVGLLALFGALAFSGLATAVALLIHAT